MAGVPVVREVYEDVTHEFFGMHALLEQARHAQDLAADRIQEAFKQ
jgi:acetyl esterase